MENKKVIDRKWLDCIIRESIVKALASKYPGERVQVRYRKNFSDIARETLKRWKLGRRVW